MSVLCRPTEAEYVFFARVCRLSLSTTAQDALARYAWLHFCLSKNRQCKHVGWRPSEWQRRHRQTHTPCVNKPPFHQFHFIALTVFCIL